MRCVMRKSVLAIVCALFVFVLSFSSNLPVVEGNDFMLQISDPKDAYRNIEIDIKSIYARTDDDNIYFRLDSWGNWNLNNNDCSIGIFFSTGAGHAVRETDYLILIIEFEGSYSVGVFDSALYLVGDYSPVFFQKDNCTGIIQISKHDIYEDDDKFSFKFAVLSHTYDVFIDESPEGDMLSKYKAGPSSKNPKLSVEPKFIDFGTVEHDASPTRNLNIINEGGGDLQARIKSSSNSLGFYPEEVHLSEYGITEVAISLDKSSKKDGYSEETITIDSNGGTASVVVKMDILPTPVLHCETKMIDFGSNFIGDRPSEKFFISNSVRGKIKGKVSANQRWMTLSKTSFDSTEEEINLTVNTKLMPPGTHNGRISITSDGGSHSFEVSVEVKSALSLDQENIDFGEFDLDETEVFPMAYLEIENLSPDTQELKIVVADPWLEASSSSLTLSKDHRDKVEFYVNRKQLENTSKHYKTQVTISTKNETFQIPVSLAIIAVPPKAEWIKKEGQNRDVRISVFAGEKIEEFIKIQNSGGGILEGSADLKSKNTPHRLFNPKFFLRKGQTHDFKIVFDSKNQELKDYREVLIVNTNSGKLEIPIIVSVIPLPEIVIKLFIGISYAYIDDKEIVLDAPPYISKGSSMVPLRFISEAFKAEIKWENIGKGRIYIQLKTNKIRLDIGEKLAFINDVACVLPVPPEIKNSRTFVPIRFISEGFGAKVEWDASKNQILIRFTP